MTPWLTRSPDCSLRDPVTLKTGEAIYIDSKMGHAYIAAEDCDEALVLGICSSEDSALMTSLMHMHEHDDGHAAGLMASAGGTPRVRALRSTAER